MCVNGSRGYKLLGEKTVRNRDKKKEGKNDLALAQNRCNFGGGLHSRNTKAGDKLVKNG